MITNLVPFNFEGSQVRIITDENGEPLFVAVDICEALTIGNSRMALDRLDDDEKGVSSIDTLGGVQEMSVINESGLYSLILGSRKPEAKRFKRWVTHEVLPTIRKTGTYSVSRTPTSLSATTHDRVTSILLIGDAVAKVPGVKPGIAMAATLTCIHDNTGLAIETLRRALPAANTPICSLNATQLGKLFNRSAKATNQSLAALGLQSRNDRDEWELTEDGRTWAEAMPYSRNGHSGYQILWNPAVAEHLKEVA